MMDAAYESDLSPKSMAEAAYTAAVSQIAVRHDENNRNRENGNVSNDPNDEIEIEIDNSFQHKRGVRPTIMEIRSENNNNSEIRKYGGEVDLGTCIKDIWKSSDFNAEEKLIETMSLLVGELDSLLQCGLGAFNDLDATTRKLTQAKELADTRSREAQRLQLIDEQSRTSLSVSELFPAYFRYAPLLLNTRHSNTY